MPIDIHTKCRILTEQRTRHPECTCVHEIVEKEMKQNLHILSGNNNEKHGYPKGHALNNYESGMHRWTDPPASRTILRLIWFLTLLTHLLKNMKQYSEETMPNLARKSYLDSIAPFHPAVLREAICAIFMTVPTRRDFMENAFGIKDRAEFDKVLANLLKPLAGFVSRLWKYYQEKQLTTLE